MNTIEKHQQLRDSLSQKILESMSILKPSIAKLKKMPDVELINCLADNSIHAERNFWRDDIIELITEIDSTVSVKSLNKLQHKALLREIVKVAQKTTSKKIK